MPNISVIVPVYNVEPFLHRCVDSILRQTEPDFELILVDDGSPDHCGEICDAYADRDQRVRVIHKKNGGLSSARNAGIDWVFANSDSRWLAFIDSDDWVHETFLQALYSAAEKTCCRMSACGFYTTVGETKLPGEAGAVFCVAADDYYCGNRHGELTSAACNKLYHRSLFKTIRYPIGKLHEDEFVTYKLVYMAEKIGVTDAALYAYYQNPEGITRSEWSPRRMDMLEAFEQQIAFAREKGHQQLLACAAEQYIYACCDQLRQAGIIYRKELRRKLRMGLKLGRACGCFPWNRAHLWAYEQAYPVKPLWWLVNQFAWKK